MREINLQGEIYALCKGAGLVPELELRTPHGRIDVGVVNTERNRLFAVIECKEYESDFEGGESEQLIRYRRLGVPVYSAFTVDCAEKAIKEIVSAGSVGVDMSQWAFRPRKSKKAPKKLYSFRLDSDTILSIRTAAAEADCSQADMIALWAVLGSSGVTGNTVACDAAVAGSSPALPTIQKDEKRAMFDELKARLAGKQNLAGLEPVRQTETPLLHTPRAPFDFEQDCEKYRVRAERNGLGLYWVGEDGEQRKRSLLPGELEKFWEKRLK